MKLLFDENLSPGLVELLEESYPDSQHVHLCGLGASRDGDIWAFAKEHDFVIVTKDSDFSERSVVQGHPPKVIWLRVGNCSTTQIALLLTNISADVQEFVDNDERACLIRRVR